jgi:biopolymer transport protein ExbB
MRWQELLGAAGPVFYLLLGLSVYTLYLLLYAWFLLRREGRVEETLLDRLWDLAQLAPLLGLLGTTLGMIRAFTALSGEPNGALLAKGVAEALVNTGMGLLVAVVAYGGRTFLSGRR